MSSKFLVVLALCSEQRIFLGARANRQVYAELQHASEGIFR